VGKIGKKFQALPGKTRIKGFTIPMKNQNKNFFYSLFAFPRKYFSTVTTTTKTTTKAEFWKTYSRKTIQTIADDGKLLKKRRNVHTTKTDHQQILSHQCCL
jgi:hypothetical protein